MHNEEQVEGAFNTKFKYKKLVAEVYRQTTKDREKHGKRSVEKR